MTQRRDSDPTVMLGLVLIYLAITLAVAATVTAILIVT